MDTAAAPETVEIIGKTWRLVFVEPVFSGNKLGEAIQGSCLIKVAIGMDPQMERDTVLHEVLHSVCSELGYGPKEEVIQSLSAALYGVLLKNPGLVDYLTLKEEGPL